jgi:hypothetical protein
MTPIGVAKERMTIVRTAPIDRIAFVPNTVLAAKGNNATKTMSGREPTDRYGPPKTSAIIPNAIPPMKNLSCNTRSVGIASDSLTV